MFLASDNGSGVPSDVLQALSGAATGYSLGYGAEAAMAEVRERLRTAFEAPEAAVYLVATGTAANALALACYAQPWSQVYCHPKAHIEEDECNAPEFYTGGAKLTLCDGADGKIDPEAFAARMAGTSDAVHHAQPGILSLTNLTELGTRYSVAEIARLSGLAHEHGLPVHLDGARLANALVGEGCTPAEMTWRAGVDVVCVGGTKNGLMGVEAVVFFDPAKAREFELRRKRGGHLFSKHRYLSAQFLAYLTDDLWLRLARDANARAVQLETGLRAAGVAPLHARGGNMLWVELPTPVVARLREAGAVFYAMPIVGKPDMLRARLVTSWSTTEADIEAFLEALRAAQG